MEQKEKKKHPLISYLFYLYFAILPLSAFAALYFEKDVWNQFTQIIDYENGAGYFLYHAFCAITFFVSAILSLIIVQGTSLPKKKLLTILIIFDAPVALLIDYITGHQISFAEMAIYDFAFEMAAFTIADIYLSIKTEHTLLLPATIFTVALLLSFYGVYSFNILKHASLKSILLFGFTFGTTTFGYYKTIKNKGVGVENINHVQATMSKVGTLAMFATWALIAYVYFKVLILNDL
jgi:hypothetical protein